MGDFRGVAIESLFSNGTRWDYHTPPIRPNTYHKVLYELPIDLKTVPKPRRNYKGTFREEDHVRLPYIAKGATSPGSKTYWELVQESLLQPIRNSRQFEAVIKTYVGVGPKFSALHDLFERNFSEDETAEFFHNILPEIIRLALNLPNILPANVPYLKSGSNRSISLSQYQISSLLANAFLCTFNHKYKSSKENNNQHIRVPGINFDRLFSEQAKHSVVEKIKCLVYYFKRIVTERPAGAVTFERKHLPRNQLPRCDASYDPIKMQKMHLSSQGTIEDNGQGFLQVDFANKFIGGGVLGHGCVQEEIRFVICPELIISRLFTEELKDNEALLIVGAEQFSKYTGYGDTFKWAGGINDQTPYDVTNGRRKTSIIAIDAVPFHNTRDQFKSGWIRREFHKAYVGFQQYQEHSPSTDDTVLPKLGPVATGNWGCGAFRGDPRLKWLIQLMAATMSKRDLVYFTFNDRVLMEELWEMHKWIVNENITVKQLWRLMCTFISTDLPSKNLFAHMREVHVKSRTQPSVLESFKNIQQKSLNSKLEKVDYSPLNTQQATSSKIKNYDISQQSFIENKDIRKQRNVEDFFEKAAENMDIDEIGGDDKSIDLTELSTSKRKFLSNEQQKLISFNEHKDNGVTIKKSPTEVDGVLDIINLLHGDRNDKQQKTATKTFFEVVDALSKKSKNSTSTECQSDSSISEAKDVQRNSRGSSGAKKINPFSRC